MAKTRFDLRQLSLASSLIASAGLIAHWWLNTDSQPYAHIDHAAFLRTIDLMHGGAGYYEAMRDAFREIDTTIGHARGYRIPTAFLVWRWIPVGWLWGTFLLVAVGGATWAAHRLARTAWAPVAVTLFMLLAGRSIGTFGFDSWMLVEIWLVPVALASTVAWRGERDWLAAFLALGATLLRETAAVFLIGGLVAALVARRRVTPWLAASGTAVALYGLHFAIASSYVEPPGTFAPLFGTGDPPRTIATMATWTLSTSPWVGVLLLVAGGAGILRSNERWLLLPVLCLPLNGLFVDRPYWGIMLIPYLLIYGIDQVTEPFSRDARSAAGEAEGSSPPPGTRRREPGTPAAEPAPPSS